MYLVRILKDISGYARIGDYIYARERRDSDVCGVRYTLVCIQKLPSQEGFGVAKDEYELIPVTNKIDKLIW